MVCSNSDRQIKTAWKQLTKVLLFKFKEYTDLNETLINEIHDFTTDINAKKDALLDSLDAWLKQIQECCEALAGGIDEIIDIFEIIPCICPPSSTTTTEEPVYTT